jgi:hypothetical protein
MGEITYRRPASFALSLGARLEAQGAARKIPTKASYYCKTQKSCYARQLSESKCGSVVRTQKQEHNQKFPHAEARRKIFTPNARNPLKSLDSKK